MTFSLHEGEGRKSPIEGGRTRLARDEENLLLVRMGTSPWAIFCRMRARLASNLARRIRELRGDQTQREFAEKLRISHATVNRLEQEKENISLKTIQRICDRLKCRVGWLFYEED